jgi:hypothetical protein
MEKRGRCRCGTVLVFQRTPQGYKTRCTVCQAVVRIREGPPAPPAADTTPPVFSVLETHESSAPRAEAEMPAYREPERPAWPSRLGWWLIPLAVAAVVVALVVAALLVR